MPAEISYFFGYIGCAIAILFCVIFAFQGNHRITFTDIGTLALAFATALVAWGAYQQLDEMRVEQRPWVHNKEMPRITKFSYLPNDNIHVEMTIDMENVGRSPAQDVSGRILIETGTFAANDILRNDICSRAEWRDLGAVGMRGITIFPNAYAPEGLFADIKKEDITVDKVGNSIAPYIVGCIAYRFPEGTVYHHTPFICVLILKVPGGIPLQRRDFHADEFVCLRQPFAALYRAD